MKYGDIILIKIAIVGAGLSGLVAARILQSKFDVTVFEKSRGAGGRMSTRRALPYYFDHGAPFFTARTSEFRKFMLPYLECGNIAQWEPVFVKILNHTIEQVNSPFGSTPIYVGVPGMNAFARAVAKETRVLFEKRIKSALYQGGGWHIEMETGESAGPFDWLLSAIPAEQAVAILPRYLSQSIPELRIKMLTCLTVMLGFEEAPHLPFDVGLVEHSPLEKIILNHTKPGRTEPFSLVAHTRHDWASEHIDHDRSSILAEICVKINDNLDGLTRQAQHRAIHGWRFATVGKHITTNHVTNKAKHFSICGDWLGSGDVEAAFNSGQSAAYSILGMMR